MRLQNQRGLAVAGLSSVFGDSAFTAWRSGLACLRLNLSKLSQEKCQRFLRCLRTGPESQHKSTSFKMLSIFMNFLQITSSSSTLPHHSLIDLSPRSSHLFPLELSPTLRRTRFTGDRVTGCRSGRSERRRECLERPRPRRRSVCFFGESATGATRSSTELFWEGQRNQFFFVCLVCLASCAFLFLCFST